MTWWHPVVGTLTVLLCGPVVFAIGLRIAVLIHRRPQPGPLRVIEGGKRAS